MKKSVLILLGLAAISLFVGLWLVNLKNTDLFPEPKNLAQKVANYVVVNGEKSTFNAGVVDEGTGGAVEGVYKPGPLFSTSVG